MSTKKDYNERLFKVKTFRGKLHLARFDWLQSKVLEYTPNASSVLDLGCFDARSIKYLPPGLLRFIGYDANWEGGLSAAKTEYVHNNKYRFIECKKVEDFQPERHCVDICISLETLEHLATKDLNLYLERLSQATKSHVFFTVPNEKGLVLLGKYLYKKWIHKHVFDRYSTKELWYATIGRLDKIERKEFAHKGFDYAEFVNQLNTYFTVLEVKGIPFGWLPKSLNFTIGIIAKPLQS